MVGYSRKITCLGIDPGVTRIGYGLVAKENGRLSYLASGLLPIPEPPQAEQLLLIEKEIGKLIRKNKPEIIALEKLFFTVNKKTGLAVAQARGIIVAAALKSKITTIEISPSQIKKSITGNGRASKKDVEKMTGLFIRLPEKKMIDDEIDALAAAITAIHNSSAIDF